MSRHHWPELHNRDNPENRRQNLIKNLRIADCYFTERLKHFIKHWLYKSLDAKWHWYRYEYQSRGGIHCYGAAKLSNSDPGLCKFSDTLLKDI